MTFSSRSITALLFWALLCSGLSAQNSFQKIYDDSLKNYARQFIQLPNSDYLIAGNVYSNNTSGDLGAPWLLRLDNSGAVVWRKTYPMPIYGSFEQVIPANDGGYLGIGHTSELSGAIQKVLAIKTDADGNFQWCTVLDDAWQCFDVQPASDGYILSGTLYHFAIGNIDGILVKLDNDGNLVWSTHYGDEVSGESLSFGSIAVASDTIYVTGQYNYQRAFLTVSATDGTLLSAKQYPDTSHLFNGLYTIRTMDEGHFMIGGSLYMEGPHTYAMTLHKIGKDGSMTISKLLYRENESLTQENMSNTSDGNFILGCNVWPPVAGSSRRTVLVKTDTLGGVMAAFRYIRAPNNSLNHTIQASDGGFVSLRGLTGKLIMTKTLPDMQVDGCCTAPLAIKTAELPTASEDINLVFDGFGQFVQNFSLPTALLSFTPSDYCPPEPVLLEETLAFCPGDSVLVAGSWHTQPGIVVDTILDPAACDTITTYTLQLLTQPLKTELIEFCPGGSVSIGGIVYTQPGTVVDTLPAATGCDTIATYVLSFTSLPQPSVVDIQCPGDLTVNASPGSQSAAVLYTLPTAATDCPCGEAAMTLVQGLPSGGSFTAGPTQVCYRATDDCGSSASCCFTVNVDIPATDEPCDVKNTACIRFEILGIFQNQSGQKTYRMRVTNTCANPLVYAVFQLPDGLTADAPATNSTYTAPSGRTYAVRNANESPFYSLRFKAAGSGIAGGQSDVFEYTLPPQAAPLFIHAAARLEGQGFYETHLNVFDCVVQHTADRPSEAGIRTGLPLPGGADFTVSPNPFADALNVTFNLEEAGTVQAVLTDLTGRLVFFDQKNLQEVGPQKFSWNTGDLPNGAYLVGLNLPGSGWAYRKVVLLR